MDDVLTRLVRAPVARYTETLADPTVSLFQGRPSSGVQQQQQQQMGGDRSGSFQVAVRSFEIRPPGANHPPHPPPQQSSWNWGGQQQG
jgi:hypothetical protein